MLVTAGSPLLICICFLTSSSYLFPLWIHSNNSYDITEVKHYTLSNNLMFSFFIIHMLKIGIL